LPPLGSIVNDLTLQPSDDALVFQKHLACAEYAVSRLENAARMLGRNWFARSKNQIVGTAIMEDARATFPTAFWTWLGSNRLIVLAGALTTLFGLIISANNVLPVLFKMLDLPDCLSYASVYHLPWSSIKNEGGGNWREYPWDGTVVSFEFREFQRTRDNIDLLNLTPRAEIPGWKTMLVRLPVCGGTAEWTASNPEQWVPLGELKRD
jgi:hypothetical protein